MLPPTLFGYINIHVPETAITLAITITTTITITMAITMEHLEKKVYLVFPSDFVAWDGP